MSKLDIFCFKLSKVFVNSGATGIILVILSSTAVERAIAQCTSHCAVARGHHLNTSIVLVAVHRLSGLFQAVSMVDSSLCHPLSTLSLSLIGHLASVDVKQHERRNIRVVFHNFIFFWGFIVFKFPFAAPDMGHCWPGEISHHHTKLLPQCKWCGHCL